MPVGDVLPGDTLADETIELDRIERELDAVELHLAQTDELDELDETDDLQDEEDGPMMSDKNKKRVAGGVIVAGLLWLFFGKGKPGAGEPDGSSGGDDHTPGGNMGGVWRIVVDGRGFSLGQGWRQSATALMTDLQAQASKMLALDEDGKLKPGEQVVIDGRDASHQKVQALIDILEARHPGTPLSVERD